MKEIVITEKNENQRLDKYLLKLFNKAPSSLIHKLLRKKRIKRNGKKADGGEILQAGDRLAFYLAEDTMDGLMEERKLSVGISTVQVVYEDEAVLLCQKPAGLLTHPRQAGEDSMIDRILRYLRQKGDYDGDKAADFTPALCNRLDRNTSGLVICGKTLAALQQINRLIGEGKLEKYYLALAAGEIREAGTLRSFHIKDREHNKVRMTEEAAAGGKEAVTEYAPVQSNGGYTLVRIKLLTGRSHQIRAHLSGLGHPILGDPKYGDLRLNLSLQKKYGLRGQLLHAERLVFPVESGLEACLPPGLAGRAFSAPPEGLFQTILTDAGMTLDIGCRQLSE